MTNDTKAFVIEVLLTEAICHRETLEKAYEEDPSSVFVFDECNTLAKLYGAAAELIQVEEKQHA